MFNLIKNKKNDEQDYKESTLMEEYKKAKNEYNQALNNFDNAEKRFIDIAIYQFNAARKKLDILIEQIKEEDINYEKI